MIGGLIKTTGHLAVASAAVLLSAYPAMSGGSIGGDCCADLEERVAELEATTVRKGNRKVSLKLSGHVNKAIVFGAGDLVDYNDGTRDIYLNDPAIVDNRQSQSRFRLTGKAKITRDLYAGFAIELGLGSGVLKDISNEGIFSELRKNELYIGSKTLGKLTIGKGSTASDGIAEIDLSGTNYLGGGSQTWASLHGVGGLSNLDGFSRKERVRYDSPTLAGFKVSASWQENDDTDIALRFGGNIGDFKLVAGVAAFNDDSADTTAVSGSLSAMHVPTGLNVTFAAGDDDAGFDYWFVQAGIKQKVFSAGATAFSAGYYESSDNERFNVALVQKIDAAAMELYANYSDIDSLDDGLFMVGSRIKF